MGGPKSNVTLEEDGQELRNVMIEKVRGHDLTIEEFVWAWNEYVKEYGYEWMTWTVADQVAAIYGRPERTLVLRPSGEIEFA